MLEDTNSLDTAHLSVGDCISFLCNFSLSTLPSSDIFSSRFFPRLICAIFIAVTVEKSTSINDIGLWPSSLSSQYNVSKPAPKLTIWQAPFVICKMWTQHDKTKQNDMCAKRRLGSESSLCFLGYLGPKSSSCGQWRLITLGGLMPQILLMPKNI